MPDLTIICPGCGAESPANMKERPLENGDTDVGLECPECSFWVHVFYTNRELMALQGQLAKFREHAGNSRRQEQRYRRKLEQYREAFDELNQRVTVQ